MPTPKKAQTIDKLAEAFARANISILTDYRGLPTSEMVALRRKMQQAGGDFKVVKNTLARFAAERTGKTALTSALEGPVAIAFGYGDVSAPAKVLATYIRDSKSSMTIKSGLLGNKLLTADEVNTLATLPPREVLLGQVLGQMKSPMARLVGCLIAPTRGLVTVLHGRIKQLEGA